jgi:hypothetical protein
MKLCALYRPLLAAALCAVWAAGLTVGSERSASSMANAANKFLGALSPEQRQQTTFPFESEELAAISAQRPADSRHE